jgi:hypothetical protein
MTELQQCLATLVTVDADFKPSVQLPTDFDHPELNKRLISSYIPTSDSIALLTEIARSLNPSSTERARTLVGTYGTGKSDLLLMICNYLSRSVDDPIMQPFYERLQAADTTKHAIISQNRANKPPFLIVLLQADPTIRFSGFVLYGLQQALERQGLTDILSKTKYQAASDQIHRWEQEGHDLYQVFNRHIQDIEGKEIAGLLADLASPQADLAFAVFLRAFKKVTGSDFNIYGYSKPHEAFVHVTRTLRERGTHSGVLLVCDEFTEFLRHYEQAIDQQSSEVDSETLAVQNVAERSTTSGAAQLHFIVASLESFAIASMESKSGQASKAIERVGGRFKHHSLLGQSSEELIKGAIRKLQEGSLLPNRQRDVLIDIAAEIWKHQGRAWVRDTIVEGTFPLHPLTTYALPHINRSVAQNSRTMFQFLKSEEETGLMGFIKRKSIASPFADWHTLLTLDVLFDYFYEGITEKKPDITDVYDHSLQALRTATVDISLAERVLKVITFCEIVAPDPVLSPTRAVIHTALNLPPETEDALQGALNTLEQVDAIYPPETAGGLYSLPVSGRVPLSKLRRMVKEASHHLTTTVSVLQSRHQPESIPAKEYNQKRGSHRELTAKYVGVEDLSQSIRLKRDLNEAPDALLWYVIATSDTERATAQSVARELTKQHEHLVMAIPDIPLHILGALRDYEALKKVRNAPDMESAARAYLSDTGTIGKSYKMHLDQAIKELEDFRKWEWFIKGIPHTVQHSKKVYEVASKLMDQLFPHTPLHTLSQHIKPGPPPKKVRDVVAEIIKGEAQIAKNARGQQEMILRTCASSFGILKQDRIEGAYEVYLAHEPPKHFIESRKIWNLIHKNLAAGKSWAKIAETLSNPPYGLYESLLLIYLAAFITYYADSIEVEHRRATSGRPNIDIILLGNLITKPQEYTLRFQPLTDAERQWLQGIVEHGIKKSLVPTTTLGKSLRAYVVDEVSKWIRQIKIPEFVEQLDSATLHEMLPEQPVTLQTAALLLIQRKDDLSVALMEDIPQALEAPQDHTQWGEEDTQQLIAQFAEVCRVVQHLPQDLLQYLENRIASIFGYAEYAPDQRWNAIYEWRMQRDIVDPNTLTNTARNFFRFIKDPRGSIEQTILKEFARSVVTINTDYLRWKSLDKLVQLETQIQKSLTEIQTVWQDAAPSENVWLEGLASTVSGRPFSNPTKSDVAQYFVDWSQSFSLPPCMTTITGSYLQNLYPDSDLPQCQDIAFLLQRIPYTVADWDAEITDILAQQFGIQSWNNQATQAALSRFTKAFQSATTSEGCLRHYVLTRITTIFKEYQHGTPDPVDEDKLSSVSDVVNYWYAAHPIPETNDLSEDARILLRHSNGDSPTFETVLLSSLPRAFPAIEQSYQQWESCTMLDRYLAKIQDVVQEIQTYIPLTEAEHTWLTSIVTKGLQQPLKQTAWEKNRVVAIVAEHIQAWLDNQRFPPFIATLEVHALRELFPKDEPYVIQASYHLLKSTQYAPEDMGTLLLDTLPSSLGQTASSALWSSQDVSQLLERCVAVCQFIRSLNSQLEHTLYTQLGMVFGIDGQEDTIMTIIAEIRHWTKQNVLLPGEKLSPNANALYKALQKMDSDYRSALLVKLPRTIQEVRQPYDQWNTWQISKTYITCVQEAAEEIAQRGRVGEATRQVQQVWEEFKQRYYTLSPEEQRWLIKTFNEEFPQ